MFTVEQIMAARAKLRSSDDFPLFIQEFVELGIARFDSFPADGHSEYFSTDGFHLATKPAYPCLPVSDTVNKQQFATDLELYQKGEMTYPIFCEQCTSSGVQKWVVEFELMTCTYFDSLGEVVYVQSIP